jgi:hypothetical protein
MSIKRGGLRLAATAFVLLLALGGAEAAPCLTSDVSLTIGGIDYAPSSCADGISQGRGPIAETNSINSALGTSGFVYLDKSAGVKSGGTVDLTFDVSAEDGNSGSWGFTWVNAGLTGVLIDLEVGLFGGNNSSAYLFEDVFLPLGTDTASGTYDINFTNHGNRQPNLSHLLLAGANVTPVTSTITNFALTPVSEVVAFTAIPEPSSAALFGSALLGGWLVSWRRKHKSQRCRWALV